MNTIAATDASSVLALKQIRQGVKYAHPAIKKLFSQTVFGTANARHTFDLPDCVIVAS